jgi:hypothetical protein
MISKTLQLLPTESPELVSTLDFYEKTVPGVKRQLLPTRTVVFCEEKNQSFETYSKDEIQDSWYHRSAYQSMQRVLDINVIMLRRGIPMDDIRYCSRGLEHFDYAVTEERRRVQADARSSVFRAQLQGKSAEEIAMDYASHTRIQSMKAFLTGIADERHTKEEAATMPPLTMTRPQSVQQLPPRPVTTSTSRLPPSYKNDSTTCAVRRNLGFPLPVAQGVTIVSVAA